MLKLKTIRIILLLPISLIYALVAYIRNKLFDINWLKSYQFEVKTINIGNLSVGGTGKSPHTLWLAQQLSTHEIAILSRGYGRKDKEFREVFVDSKVEEVGDEPLMMKLDYPSLSIYVQADRVVGVTNILAEKPQTDIILLDDCFQHRYIKPSFNILLTTYAKPFYEDFVLPSGNLRELRIGARRAQAIIVTKCHANITEDQKENCKTRIQKYSSAPVFFSYFKYVNAKHFKTSEELQTNAEVIIFTGLADNSDLVKYVETKHKIIEIISYPDHHQYNKYNIDRIIKKIGVYSDKKIALITTEKDFVKLINDQELFKLIQDLPLYIQKISVEFVDNDAFKLLELVNKTN